MDTTSGLVDLIEKFGWSGALLVAAVLGGWKVCRFLAIKLFDETPDTRGLKTGYIPRIVEAHLEMVWAVKTTAEENTKILAANEGTNREILLLVKEGRDETRSMNRAIMEMSQNRLGSGAGHTAQSPSGMGVL